MSINLITGYNINENESGEVYNRPSQFSFAPYTVIMSRIPLDDESDVEWMYNQQDYEYDTEIDD